MASAIIHLAIAKKVLEHINVEDQRDYYLGSIAPDIAKQIGVTGSAVTQWETRGLSPMVKHMVMLSEIYGVPLDLLVARKAV